MESLYKILEINKTNDLKTIKKAYVSKVKMYPPEAYPKEFEKIREAYEKLSEYAKSDEAKELISEENNDTNKYIKKAKEFLDLKQYDKALIAYERALLECDERIEILNEIGDIYIHKGEVDKAISKFEDILNEDSTYDITYANLADAHLKKENYNLARLNYEKAYELNNSEEYQKLILDTYVNEKDVDALLDSLKQYDLAKDDLIDYYISCVNLLVESNDDEKLNEVLKILYKNISLNSVNVENVGEQLYRTSLLLYKDEHYKTANLICEYGLKIHETAKLTRLKQEIEYSATLNNVDIKVDTINDEDVFVDIENPQPSWDQVKYGLCVAGIIGAIIISSMML